MRDLQFLKPIDGAISGTQLVVVVEFTKTPEI